MLILGIETSCDETAAAVVRDGVEILSNVVVSQIDIFAEYGGVIPEVAARSHLEAMLPVVEKALSDAGVGWEEIDAIAVTHAPGLLGSLLVGTLTARVMAILHGKPLYAVHHLKSHVYANWLSADRQSRTRLPRDGVAAARRHGGGTPHFSVVTCGSPRKARSGLPGLGSTIFDCPSFPLLALVVSGGHTQILYMRGHNRFEVVGTTHDDAVGECFDKVAKILGLPYPGGPAIAMAAEGQKAFRGHTRGRSAKPTVLEMPSGLPGNPDRYRLPHPRVEGLDFSFSGLKTAVLRAVQKEAGVGISYPSHGLAELLSRQQVADFAASFQKTAVEILAEKLEKALELYPETRAVAVAGGVSANEVLRNTITERLSGMDVFFPDPKLSGDNGAMVAAAGYFEILTGVEATDPYELNIYPRVSVEVSG